MNENKRARIVKDFVTTSSCYDQIKDGIVLMKKSDYTNKIETLSNDRRKFKVIPADLTPTRLNALQKYFKKLHKRGELSDDLYKRVRVHGLPKSHKKYWDIPSI